MLTKGKKNEKSLKNRIVNWEPINTITRQNTTYDNIYLRFKFGIR